MEGLLPYYDGLSITPIHLSILSLAMFSLLISPNSLPQELRPYLGMYRRAMVFLVLGITVYSIVTIQLKRLATSEKLGWSKEDQRAFDKLMREADIEPLTNEWDNVDAHPSRFLTTPHGRPRLFPFPLGKAGGNKALKGELWWEAGNATHVGHFNRSDDPEEREKVEAEMKAREKKRLDTAKKTQKACEEQRAKWNKRLFNIKLIGIIIVISLFYRKVAAVGLAGFIYYTLAIQLQAMLKTKEKEKKEPSTHPRKRKTQEPGMALAYLYEPAADGVIEQAVIPVQAGMNKLITTTDRRYAS